MTLSALPFVLALVPNPTQAEASCGAFASTTVVALEDTTPCRLDELVLRERYCVIDYDATVCAFLSTLPDDTTLACVEDGDNTCAAAVDRQGSRDFYAVQQTTTLERMATNPRWTADPVALQSWSAGWMRFDPSCSLCGGATPEVPDIDPWSNPWDWFWSLFE